MGRHMRNYETIVIVRSDANEEYIATLSKKVEKAITSKPGSLIKKDDWGIKRLAYEIKKEKQGHYVYWAYQHNEKAPAAVDKCLRFEENVLRYMTVVTDRDPKSAREKKTQEKAKSKRAAKYEGKENERMKVDFKDVVTLSNYITEKGKIIPQRNANVGAVTQRAIATAVKRARQIALLSYTEGFRVSSNSTTPEERSEGYGGHRGGYRNDREDRGGDRGEGYGNRGGNNQREDRTE